MPLFSRELQGRLEKKEGGKHPTVVVSGTSNNCYQYRVTLISTVQTRLDQIDRLDGFVVAAFNKAIADVLKYRPQDDSCPPIVQRLDTYDEYNSGVFRQLAQLRADKAAAIEQKAAKKELAATRRAAEQAEKERLAAEGGEAAFSEPPKKVKRRKPSSSVAAPWMASLAP